MKPNMLSLLAISLVLIAILAAAFLGVFGRFSRYLAGIPFMVVTGIATLTASGISRDVAQTARVIGIVVLAVGSLIIYPIYKILAILATPDDE